VEPAGAPLLEVDSLSVVFYSGRRRPPVRALEDVSLRLGREETVGLVGESGSGKTTVARAVLGMVRATSGSIRLAGEDITPASRKRRRELSRQMQVVFQDPYGSLSPTRTIGQTLAEPLLAHKLATTGEARRAATEMLERVGMTAEAMVKVPSEFSGGQRQRIAIARALMLSPQLVICDEPVSSLDLSVQAQVLNLLHQLQADLGLSYLFIAHNLSVVRHMSRRLLVLYRGQLMETGDAASVYDRPRHPYTRMLLDAVPVADPALQTRRREALARLPGLSDTTAPAGGCPFARRCAYAIADCTRQRPPLVPVAGGEVACLRADELPPYERTAPAPGDPVTPHADPVAPHAGPLTPHADPVAPQAGAPAASSS
jgi:peptide/nickel transport system ATP-binding protein